MVTVECIDKIVRKDMRHPLSGDPLVESDIIVLQRGGTGFASVNADQLKAVTYRPMLSLQ